MQVIVAMFQRIWLISSKTQVDFQLVVYSLAPLYGKVCISLFYWAIIKLKSFQSLFQ